MGADQPGRTDKRIKEAHMCRRGSLHCVVLARNDMLVVHGAFSTKKKKLGVPAVALRSKLCQASARVIVMRIP